MEHICNTSMFHFSIFGAVFGAVGGEPQPHQAPQTCQKKETETNNHPSQRQQHSLTFVLAGWGGC